MTDYSEIDLAIALQLQAQFEEERRVQLLKAEQQSSKTEDCKSGFTKDGDLREPEQEKLSVSLIDPTWELLDPNPKIHDLFLIFNDQFFWGRLSGITVSWSPRMTLCAGVCSYERRGGLCSVRLSVPLLKLRPRKDLVETLLHEMIHAYLFVTKNDTDHDGHGPQFHKHMFRINKIAGTKISVYHQFHDEVDVYRQHIWLCDGPCKKRRPYFGLVKRSMNRAPSERDPWWQQHKLSCGGIYTKIKEPQGYGVKSKKIKVSEGATNSKPTEDIRKFFTPTQDSNSSDKENLGKPHGSNINRLDLSSNDASKLVKKIGGNVHGINVGKNSKGKNSSGKRPVVPKNPKSKSPSNDSASKPFKGGGGIGMRKAGGTSGSSTVTVGPQQQRPSTDTKAPAPNVTSVSNFTPFAGQGNCLGSTNSNAGVSRLLSLQNKNKQFVGKSKSTSSTHNLPSLNSVISPQSSVSEDEFLNHQSSGEENQPSNSVKCPLCRKELNSASFDDHISLCLGDFDEWNDDFVPNQIKRASDSYVSGNEIDIFSSSSNRDSFGDDGAEEMTTSELDDSVVIVGATGLTSLHATPLENNIIILDSSEGTPHSTPQLYPCPVCNDSFIESAITGHVNQHFS